MFHYIMQVILISSKFIFFTLFALNIKYNLTYKYQNLKKFVLKELKHT